jgi:hypothetical protein
VRDIKPKSLVELNERATELLESGLTEQGVYDTMFKELVVYYNTLEGQEELMNSPHRTLRPTDAVALLMEDVRIISKRHKVKKEKRHKEKKEKEQKEAKEKKEKGGK